MAYRCADGSLAGLPMNIYTPTVRQKVMVDTHSGMRVGYLDDDGNLSGPVSGKPRGAQKPTGIQQRRGPAKPTASRRSRGIQERGESIAGKNNVVGGPFYGGRPIGGYRIRGGRFPSNTPPQLLAGVVDIDDPQLGSIFSAIGKAVKGAAKGVGKAAKAVAKAPLTVAKVAGKGVVAGAKFVAKHPLEVAAVVTGTGLVAPAAVSVAKKVFGRKGPNADDAIKSAQQASATADKAIRQQQQQQLAAEKKARDAEAKAAKKNADAAKKRQVAEQKKAEAATKQDAMSQRQADKAEQDAQRAQADASAHADVAQAAQAVAQQVAQGGGGGAAPSVSAGDAMDQMSPESVAAANQAGFFGNLPPWAVPVALAGVAFMVARGSGRGRRAR